LIRAKPLFKISAAEVLADYLPDNVPQNAIFILISLFIDRLKL
jgi:hypothetical protein